MNTSVFMTSQQVARCLVHESGNRRTYKTVLDRHGLCGLSNKPFIGHKWSPDLYVLEKLKILCTKNL